jgi:DNA replication protein DnaC
VMEPRRYTMRVDPNELMTTLGALRERQAENEMFARTFTCPVRRGELKPCLPDVRGPQIPAPHGWIRCPVSPPELCEPELAHRDAVKASERAEQLARARAVGLEGKLAAASFATAKDTQAVAAMREYLAGPFSAGRALTLTGSTGIGKTWSAACAINALDCPRRFVYSPAFANELMNPAKREEAMGRAKTTRFFVWDDLGAEYLREGSFLDGLHDELIWARENLGLPTVITTNLGKEALRTRLSPRIVDRLVGWGEVIELDGRSKR